MKNVCALIFGSLLSLNFWTFDVLYFPKRPWIKAYLGPCQKFMVEFLQRKSCGSYLLTILGKSSHNDVWQVFSYASVGLRNFA